MANSKVILVVLDGLGYGAATQELGYMEGMVQAGKASKWKVKTSLPSNSRPLYETIHTGLTPIEHGVLTNDIVRLSHCEHLFSICRANDRTTAAAAYSWMSELYNHVPYDPVEDREQDDESRNIQHGRFYQKDDYPDFELFADAELLIRRYHPDFMLIHPMGCDYKGHVYGGSSDQYHKQASRADQILSTYMPAWLEKGYEVLVTADHGMDEKGWHGGTLEVVQHVPLYHVSSSPIQNDQDVVDQCAIAPTVLKLMGLSIPDQMKVAALNT
ncbi:alkaline phosphatase family protein [Curvivirga sp.]|uniref:alkaline phosphatase family protein n=1 Tax=Curvivirga sp. TaxID=2856848 RepID=UPI003B5B7A9A